MYNYDMLCTYKLMGNDEDNKIMYQIQLLQLLCLQNYDDHIVSNKINEIYKKYENHSDIIELLEKHPYKDNFLNKSLLFQTLFSFDTLDIFHKCLQNLNKENKIKKENKENINKIILEL